MFNYMNVTQVHLEVTDKCNASCPMCPRNINGGPLNSKLRNIEMSLELAKSVFTKAFLKRLKFIQLCGNFGDPIIAKDTLEILKYFRKINKNITLGIHTNGSARSADWWRQLGKMLRNNGDYCKFALDGLADTNAIYRRNTNWDKIMTSAKSFIDSGGNAHWEFLVFRHNEHQIEEARKLSKEMGFKTFYTKKSSRFYNHETGEIESFPIYNEKKETIGFLQPPLNLEYVNQVATIKKKDPLREKQIDCMATNEGSVFITAAGEILPCCFIGGVLQYEQSNEEPKYLRSLMAEAEAKAKSVETVEKNKFKIFIDYINSFYHKENPVRDAVNGNFFKKIEESWHQKDSKIETCSMICEKKYKIVKSEYE